MAGLTQIFRRTLATNSAVHPPCSPLPVPIMGGTVRWRTLGKVVGPGAHLSKNILNTNTKKIYSYFTNNKRRSDLYILSPKKYTTFSGEEEEREINIDNKNNKKAIRVSRDSIEGEGGMGGGNQIRNRNGVANGDCSKLGADGGVNDNASSKLLTLPTLLTLARVASIPLFIASFYVNSRLGTTATTSIFVAAAITDWLDGYLARKMRLGTVFGAFLDPVADKLMVAATLVLLCSRPPETAFVGNVLWLFPVPAIAIIGREITMSAVREWAASQNTKLLQAVAVNNLGKWKTATQMTALTILVVSRDSSLAGSGALAASGVALLYISAGLAVWSLVVYMRKIWKVLLR